MKTFYVYILTNKWHTTLYVGVTNNLQRRIIEHKVGKIEGFTKQYNLKKLVYVEQHKYIFNAIQREKKLKHWPRPWKNALIEQANPEWIDLYEPFFGAFSESEWTSFSKEIPDQVGDDKK